MAVRVVHTNQKPISAGVVPVMTAMTAEGSAIYNSGKTVIVVTNGSGSPVNITLKTPGTTIAGAVPDKVVAVAAGVTKWFGNLAPSLYNQADGCVYVDVSLITSVTIGCFEP